MPKCNQSHAVVKGNPKMTRGSSRRNPGEKVLDDNDDFPLWRKVGRELVQGPGDVAPGPVVDDDDRELHVVAGRPPRRRDMT